MGREPGRTIPREQRKGESRNPSQPGEQNPGIENWVEGKKEKEREAQKHTLQTRQCKCKFPRNYEEFPSGQAARREVPSAERIPQRNLQKCPQPSPLRSHPDGKHPFLESGALRSSKHLLSQSSVCHSLSRKLAMYTSWGPIMSSCVAWQISMTQSSLSAHLQ